MGFPLSRLLILFTFFALFLPISSLRGQDVAAEAPPTNPTPDTRRPDSPSITIHVTDMPGAWQSLRETRLRQSLDALLALPFVAEDDSVAALKASLALIAERGGIEPTFDSLLGENTRALRLILFQVEDLEDPAAMPYVIEATMASPQLARVVGDVLEANLSAQGVLVRAASNVVTLTNAPERLMQDRMADWRSPRVQLAFDHVPLEGAQMRFFAQPARDKESGGGDKISAGQIRFQPERIDMAMHSVPAREGGSLRVPAAEGLSSLDRLVTLAETPHVFSFAYHGAATMLENAAKNTPSSRGRLIASNLERTSGVTVGEMLEAFGEDASLAINTLSIRSMFDFSLGLSGAWEVRDHDKAAAILESLRETHQANLAKDAQSYGRSADGVRFREEDHRGLTVWSAPLMIFPIQPSAPPTLNLALADDVLLMATSRESIMALIDRHLDGTGDTTAIDMARAGHDLPRDTHSLGTVDFVAFAEVLRRALPVIVALTQGGNEAQIFGRAVADVIGSLGHGTSAGIYEPEGHSVRMAILLAPSNPAP